MPSRLHLKKGGAARVEEAASAEPLREKQSKTLEGKQKPATQKKRARSHVQGATAQTVEAPEKPKKSLPERIIKMRKVVKLLNKALKKKNETAEEVKVTSSQRGDHLNFRTKGAEGSKGATLVKKGEVRGRYVENLLTLLR